MKSKINALYSLKIKNYGAIPKSEGVTNYPLTNEMVEVVNRIMRQSEGCGMVCQMMNISFFNCLMPQCKGGNPWKMADQRSHNF